jgi:hypothetical protein
VGEQPWLGGVELGRRAMQDDGQLTHPRLEAALEALASGLELAEHRHRVVGVARVVAGGEGGGGRLEPGHPATRPAGSR